MEENELISVDNNNAVEYTDDNIRHLSDMEHVRTCQKSNYLLSECMNGIQGMWIECFIYVFAN